MKKYSHMVRFFSGSNQSDLINQKTINEKIKSYGFIECGQIQLFLKNVCDIYPGCSELKYIRDKLKECLSNHDNQSDYFESMRSILFDINEEIKSRISAEI